jgi:hypothetical protein
MIPRRALALLPFLPLAKLVRAQDKQSAFSDAKVVAEIRKVMRERIRDAKGPEVGIGNVTGTAGFPTPESFCRARDLEYQLCLRLLKAGTK